MRFCLFYTTVATQDQAESLAKAALGGKSAACVTILAPAKSFYHWQGNIAEETEIPILFKTLSENRARLISVVLAIHPYETPAMIDLEAASASVQYDLWLQQTLK